MSWILILWLYAGPMSNADSMAITTAPFATEALCKAAGSSAAAMTSGTVKSAKFVCARNN